MYRWTRAWKLNSTGITAAELYASLPLGKAGSNSIRVLDLVPRFRSRRLRAQLRVVSFGPQSLSDSKTFDHGSAPQYEALSYTWGESTRGDTISLDDGVQVPITDNLHQALRRLRHWTKTRTIWVDALCINQSDTIERSGQVQMMDQIYKTASCVNIWLGEPGYVFPISRTMLRWIWKFRSQLLKLVHSRTDYSSLNPFTWHVFRLHPEALEKAMAKSSPRWYDRVWVVQEYILAANTYFCYGSRRTKSVEILESLAPVLPATDFEHFWTLQDRVWRTWEMAKPDRDKFVDLSRRGITTVAACATLDPRDRVYGVLGFLNPDEKALVPVDYSLPPCQVYAAATAASMVVQQHHKILGFVSIDNRKTHDLPSWAVDFEEVSRMIQPETMTPYLPILVENPTARENSIARDLGSLQVCGFHCGTVQNIIPLHGQTRNTGMAAHLSQGDMEQRVGCFEYEEWCDEFVRRAVDTAAASTTTTTRAHNTDRLDIMFLKKLATDLDEANVAQLGPKSHTEWMHRAAWNQTPQHGGPSGTESRDVVKNWIDIVLKAPNNLFITAKTMKMGLEDLYAYALYALAASNGCCLFLTSTGLVGIAPSSINTGDLLVLGQGSNFPFLLLKPVENRYEFHGLPMMHGLNSHLDPWAPLGRLADLAAWAGVTQKREWFEIR